MVTAYMGMQNCGVKTDKISPGENVVSLIFVRSEEELRMAVSRGSVRKPGQAVDRVCGSQLRKSCLPFWEPMEGGCWGPWLWHLHRPARETGWVLLTS